MAQHGLVQAHLTAHASNTVWARGCVRCDVCTYYAYCYDGNGMDRSTMRSTGWGWMDYGHFELTTWPPFPSLV